jgi:quinol monooxygenase YgiN
VITPRVPSEPTKSLDASPSHLPAPTNITILEVYADAYKAHLDSPHFKKYKSATQEMVKSLELVDTVPIMLRAQPK